MPEEEEQKGEAAAAASAMLVSPLPWPESAVLPESARFSANRAESEQRRRESAKKKKKDTWPDAVGCAGSGVARESQRPAAGTAPLEPRLCFPACPQKQTIFFFLVCPKTNHFQSILA